VGARARRQGSDNHVAQLGVIARASSGGAPHIASISKSSESRGQQLQPFVKPCTVGLLLDASQSKAEHPIDRVQAGPKHYGDNGGNS
jgi:hypothetical protein